MYSLKSDLDAVKSRAKMFLYLDFQIDEQMGLFVHHPYYTTVIEAVKKNGKAEMIDIRDPEMLKEKQDEIINAIMSAKSYMQLLFMIRGSYLPAFFKSTYRHLSYEDFSEALAHIWLMTEFPNIDVNVSKKEFIRFFGMALKNKLMDSEEYIVYQNFPEVLTVYRGVTEGGTEKALSWTLDLEKAKWFATRWGKNGKVFKAKIKRDYVLAFFSGRNESEVVIDYRWIDEPEELPISSENQK